MLVTGHQQMPSDLLPGAAAITARVSNLAINDRRIPRPRRGPNWAPSTVAYHRPSCRISALLA
ncbi:hypothetical protein MCHIJ_16680 [Mycolicibacterium chitae]|nr:hypothetical protein MCHIJ_16680 [Mycolicibacterium chitae]